MLKLYLRLWGLVLLMLIIGSVFLFYCPIMMAGNHEKHQKKDRYEPNDDPYTDAQNIDTTYADWMNRNKKVLMNAAINDVTLLGSHDSGAYNIRKGNPPSKGYLTHHDKHVKRHAKAKDVLNANCQSTSIYGQLLYGVRSLDLRICHQEGKYWIAHIWLSIACFGENGAFAQIKKFLKEHPDEVIIVCLTQLWGEKGPMTVDEANVFYKKAEEALNGLLIEKNTVNKLTYGQIWKSKGRVILMGRSDNGEYCQSYPDDKYIWKHQIDSKWFDQPDPQVLIAELNNLVTGWENGKGKDKLRHLSCEIDAGKKIPDAARSNPFIKQKLQTDWESAPISIVGVDDAVNSNLMPILLSRISGNKED